MTTKSHQPVMLQEVIAGLNIDPEGIYIDGTFGRGGHSEAILEKLNAQGQLLCFDKDPEAIAFGCAHYQDSRISFYQSCFSRIGQVIHALKLGNNIKGILLDLGVSSPQLEAAQRGFSFMRDGPLDMRMDPSTGRPVSEWINGASYKEMVNVLWRYGEEPFAKKISKAILDARLKKPLVSTLELANLVTKCLPYQKSHQHPATKTFQAMRIFVNQELSAINKILIEATGLLAPKGRLVIISFHSLEDRMVKQFFRQFSRVNVPKGLPILEKELISPCEWVVKRQKPSIDEVAQNPRARSATLRVLQKRDKER